MSSHTANGQSLDVTCYNIRAWFITHQGFYGCTRYSYTPVLVYANIRMRLAEKRIGLLLRVSGFGVVGVNHFFSHYM